MPRYHGPKTCQRRSRVLPTEGERARENWENIKRSRGAGALRRQRTQLRRALQSALDRTELNGWSRISREARAAGQPVIAYAAANL